MSNLPKSIQVPQVRPDDPAISLVFVESNADRKRRQEQHQTDQASPEYRDAEETNAVESARFGAEQALVGQICVLLYLARENPLVKAWLRIPIPNAGPNEPKTIGEAVSAYIAAGYRGESHVTEDGTREIVILSPYDRLVAAYAGLEQQGNIVPAFLSPELESAMTTIIDAFKEVFGQQTVLPGRIMSEPVKGLTEADGALLVDQALTITGGAVEIPVRYPRKHK
jgi:hypothetical protein